MAIMPVTEELETVDLAQQVDRAVEEAEARLAIVQRVMQVALKATFKQDWLDFGGKPYLASTGAERLANLFGVTLTDLETKRYEDRDERGTYYWFVVSGVAHFRGASLAVMGTCSARDQFFSVRYEGQGTDRTQVLLPADQVDPTNIVKAAYSNLVVNAVTRVLGIRGLTWDQLKQLGFDQAQAAQVRFQDRRSKPASAPATKGGTSAAPPAAAPQTTTGASWVARLEALLDTIDADEGGRRDILRSVTSFDKKEGGRFEGYDSLDALRAKSKNPEKVAEIAHDKLRKQVDGGYYATKSAPATPEEQTALPGVTGDGR